MKHREVRQRVPSNVLRMRHQPFAGDRADDDRDPDAHDIGGEQPILLLLAAWMASPTLAPVGRPLDPTWRAAMLRAYADGYRPMPLALDVW